MSESVEAGGERRVSTTWRQSLFSVVVMAKRLYGSLNLELIIEEGEEGEEEAEEEQEEEEEEGDDGETKGGLISLGLNSKLFTRALPLSPPFLAILSK